jgi:hypothetical protein
MTATRPASGHRLIIERWNVTYCAPQIEPLAHTDRKRLDELLRTEVAAALARSVETSIESADPSVWRIRSLSIDLAQQSGPFSSIGPGARQAWATHLASAILGEMHDDADSSRVLRFPSRADYLAHFLVDLVGGRAWDRWYFEEFDSLRSLSTSRAICEVLLQQEGDVAAALIALLSNRGLHDILEALSLSDAGRLFESCFLSGSTATSSVSRTVWCARLLEIWSQTPCRIHGDNPWRDGLWWLAIAAAHFENCELEREPIQVISSLLQIRSLFLSLPSLWHRGRLIQLIAQGQLNDAAQFAHSPNFPLSETAIEDLASHMQGDLDWGLNAISILTGDQSAVQLSVAADKSGGASSHLSHFAGIFRLGPSFLDNSVQRILSAALRNVEDAPLLSLLIHLVAAKCLGAERAAASLDDVALRLFSGLDSDSFARSFDKAQSAGTLINLDFHAIHAALLQELLAAGRTDRTRWVTVPCSSSIFLIDSDTRTWLDIATPGAPAFASVAISSSAEPPVADRSVLSGRSPSVDLAYFSLAEALPALPPQLDLVLTLVAHCVFDHFTRRLMGFHLSSPPYIYENFLVGSGTLRDDGQSVHVTLAPPPLAVILRIAGIDRETCTLPWMSPQNANDVTEGKEVCILPE